MLDQRVTLQDSSLFTGTAGRNKELLQRFAMIGPDLVNLAITHEMGHALCSEKTNVKRMATARNCAMARYQTAKESRGAAIRKP